MTLVWEGTFLRYGSWYIIVEALGSWKVGLHGVLFGPSRIKFHHHTIGNSSYLMLAYIKHACHNMKNVISINIISMRSY
jgi:hypothetical protein